MRNQSGNNQGGAPKKLMLPAKYAPYAREMRIAAARLPLTALWEHQSIINYHRDRQLATRGKVSYKTAIVQHCISDELMFRLLGHYPVDKFEFVVR